MYDVSLANTRAMIESIIRANGLLARVDGDTERFGIVDSVEGIKRGGYDRTGIELEIGLVKAGADVLIRGGTKQLRDEIVRVLNERETDHFVHLDKGTVKASSFVSGNTYAYANYGLRASGLVYGESESFLRSADRAILAVTLFEKYRQVLDEVLPPMLVESWSAA